MVALIAAAAGLALTSCTVGPPATREPAGESPPAVSPASPPGSRGAAAGTPTPTVESPAPATGPPAPAEALADPQTAAAALTAAERAIRDPGTPPGELPGWAHVQQAVYRRLATRPAWRAAVRGGLPAALRPVLDANLAAAGELSDLVEPREELPPWRIVAPPPAGTLLGFYRSAAAEFGLDWTYLAAIHLVETRMGRIRGTSTAGARGPMQFMPRTWEAYGEGDIEDPEDAIRAAARYLAASGAPHDMDGALFAYNRSRHYVRAISAYAGVMREDPRAYRGYYHWRVHYRLKGGDVVLEEGYDGTAR